MKAVGLLFKCKKSFLGYKIIGVYIVHSKCENTRIPKILAYKRDKVLIHQNGVVWDQIYKNHKAAIFAMQENFASLAKISLA